MGAADAGAADPGAADPGPACVGQPRGDDRDEIVAGDRVAGVRADELAARFGTPLYVYDLDLVEGRVAALRRVLPRVVDLAFAVKANPALAVIAFIGSLGVGADVASGGELEAALRAGIPADRIVMTGPGKRDGELAAAAAAGVRAVTVESPGELARLERIAADGGRRVPVLLRASVVDGPATERVRLVGDGGAGKFGMSMPDLRSAARMAADSPHLVLLGVHRFGASNVTDAGLLAAHIAETVELGREVASIARVPLELVDVGGGLGIPYGPADLTLDLDDLGRRVAHLADGWAAAPDTRGTRVLLEPGRFLVGPAGAYLTRVVDRKRAGDGEVAVLDGGIHHLLRPVLVGQEHRVRVLGALSGTASARPVTLVGPLCTGLDVLAVRASLPLPNPGDLVAVLDVGAYGFTESMPLFLSHATPAEVAVRGGRARLIRQRMEPETWLATQVMPSW
jgi:diaminopimelate decarboxylase